MSNDETSNDQKQDGKKDSTGKPGATSAPPSPRFADPRLMGPRPPAPKGFYASMPVAIKVKPLPTLVKDTAPTKSEEKDET